MIRSIKKCFWAILVLVILTTSFPLLLHLEDIRSKVNSQLCNAVAGKVNLSHLEWSWLPLPHLKAKNLSIENKQIFLTCPVITIYPKWSSIFSAELTLKKIKLSKPEFILKSIEKSSENIAQLPTVISDTKIIISDASIAVNPDLSQKPLTPEAFNFHRLYGSLKISSSRLLFNFSTSPDWSSRIRANGLFNIKDSSYKINLKTRDFKLNKLLPELFNKKFVALEPPVGFEADLSGQIDRKMKVDFRGTLPSFSLRNDAEPTSFSNQYCSFIYEQENNNHFFNLRSLQMNSPSFFLNGLVQLTNPEQSEEPHCLIKLTGKNLDATQIRKRVIALIGRHWIAKLVCDIVLGGKATKAEYYFNSGISSFKNISAMSLYVDIANSKIHVPAVDLFLTEASGPIAIKNGQLSGCGLKAKMGESRGWDGTLLVGLKDNDNSFKLSLDLDANLVDLPPILERMVDHQDFQSELKRFSNLNGRAKGKLTLGETFDNISVEVDVSQPNLTFNYNRLSKPVTINKGTLQVQPTQVSWQDISALMGPHEIKKGSGIISWDKEPELMVNLKDTNLDSTELIKELNTNNAIPKSINLDTLLVSGPINIINGTLKGPAALPEKWTYEVDFTVKDMMLAPQELPQPVFLSSGNIRLTDKSLSIADGKTGFFMESFTVNGLFPHELLANWYGEVELNGIINEEIGIWLKKKGWIPKLFFPNLPLILEKFNLAWTADNTIISGRIKNNTAEEKSPFINMLIDINKDTININQLQIVSVDSQKTMNITSTLFSGKDLKLSWQGKTDAETITALVHKQYLKTGVLGGNGSLMVSLDKPSDIQFTGYLNGENIKFFNTYNNTSIELHKLHLDGYGNQIQFEKVNLGLNNESLSVSGILKTGSKGINLDLKLAAETISWKNIAPFVDENTQSTSSAWDKVTGKFKIEADEFISGINKPDFKESNQNFSLNMIEGLINRPSKDSASLEITSAKFCGMDLTGKYNINPEDEPGEFKLSTPTTSQLRVENIFPCLGIDQEGFIEGSFYLNADFNGIPGNWKSGKVDIFSQNGRIHRLSFLAKVFSVLNITDIFSSSDGLPDLVQEGLSYKTLELQNEIKDNQLNIKTAVLKGEGMNIFAHGSMDLIEYKTDFTLLIAPLKTIDSIISKIPILREALLKGKTQSIMTIPVGITGEITSPEINILPASAVGKSILNIFSDIITLPFTVLSPILPEATEVELENVY
jgi:hypothetical protein